MMPMIATLFTFKLFYVLVNSDLNERHAASRLEEYCNMETFRPQCMKNEVVVIEEAYYGRRQVGKCIDAQEASDFAHDSRLLGCFADVIGPLNARCSGKKQCEVRIADPELETTRTCRKGLLMFLEVSYSCLPVVEEDRSCVVSLTSNPLFIAAPAESPSSAAQSNIELHCGTRTQPWLLEATAGQRINVSLLDFTPSTSTNNSRFRDDDARFLQGTTSNKLSRIVNCGQQRKHQQQYGYIVDKSFGRGSNTNISVCSAGTKDKLVNVYLSTANLVEFVFDEPETLRRNHFLIRIEAVGCSNIVPPEDAWVKREDDKIIIGCYTSRQTWQLRCQDGRWIGVVSNCTHSEALKVQPGFIEEKLVPAQVKSYQVASVVAIAFTGLAFCLMIICCGAVCLNRYKMKKRSTKKCKGFGTDRQTFVTTT